MRIERENVKLQLSVSTIKDLARVHLHIKVNLN